MPSLHLVTFFILVWIRNEADLHDLIDIMQCRVSTLWCNGQTNTTFKNKKSRDSSESDEENKQQKKGAKQY